MLRISAWTEPFNSVYELYLLGYRSLFGQTIYTGYDKNGRLVTFHQEVSGDFLHRGKYQTNRTREPAKDDRHGAPEEPEERLSEKDWHEEPELAGPSS